MFAKRYQLPGLTTRRWLRTRPTPGPNPNHPPLHANNSAFLMNAEILFYLARGYVQRRQTFDSSISNLSLSLNSKACISDWTMELCLPNNDRVNNHTLHTLHTIIHYIHYIHYIQSYITYITYNHTFHTNANHTICRSISQPFILTTHSSNMKVGQ